MSDIKNLFASAFKEFDLTQFPESDLIKLGIREMCHREQVKKQQKQKVKKEKPPKEPKCCAPKQRNPFKQYGKIVPIEPSQKPVMYKYKHIQTNETPNDKLSREIARNRAYYHSHREELKYKRLAKQGRYDVIELLLNSLPE